MRTGVRPSLVVHTDTAYCSNGSCKSRTTEFTVPATTSPLAYITAGADGNLWFTAGQVGRITLAGAVTLFNPLVATGLFPGATAQAIAGITKGPDGNIWFSLVVGNGYAYLGSVTPAGVVSNYPLSTTGYPEFGEIASGPDGNLWLAEESPATPGSSTTVFVSTVGGTFTTYTLPNSMADPFGIAAGPDGNMWVLETDGNKIAKVTPSGAITEFTIPTASSGPMNIAAGSDGNLWFTESSTNKIGRITPTGSFAEFPVSNQPVDICKGPDGNVWFTEAAYQAPGNLGRITPAGEITEYSLTSSPGGIASGPDGNVWFTEADVGKIGQFVTP